MKLKWTVLQWTALAAWVVLTAGTTSGSAQSAGSPSADPVGEWTVAKAVARIRIVDCNNRLWGVVSWEASPGTDSKNPDASLRTRPTLGMPILLGMTRKKDNQWSGEIYNSEDGRRYAASISLRDQNTLQVQGCVLGILCGGEDWTRAPQPDTAATAPNAAPAARPSKSASPSASKAATPAAPTDPAADICLRVAGASGLPH